MNYKDLNTDDFTFQEGVFCGREAILINPNHSDSGWTKDNLEFRSVIVDKNSGEVLSRSLPKFFNYGQSPDLYPDPLLFDDWSINLKYDGSLLILDVVDGIVSVRTRGIFNYITQQNSSDFEQLFVKYPGARQMLGNENNKTFLFEILTPNNRIVVSYPEIDFVFVGAVLKETAINFPNFWLDEYAEKYKLRRPEYFSFDDMESLIKDIKNWPVNEGVVVSYNGGSNRVKLKADRYCFLHRVMSGIRNKKEIINTMIELGCPCKADLSNHYANLYDWEIANEIEPEISQIYEKIAEINEKKEKVEEFVGSFGSDFSRREIAKEVLARYSDWRSAYAFAILDGKSLDPKTLTKLLIDK